MKMPIRYNIVRQLVKNPGGLTPYEIFDILKAEYQGERTCSPKEIDKQLMSLKGSGLADDCDAVISDTGELIMTYRITEYGINQAKKYIGQYISQPGT